MRVSDALVSSAVVVQPAWETLDDVVAGLVDQLAASARLPRQLVRTAVACIQEREAAASTPSSARPSADHGQLELFGSQESKI